MIETNGCKKTSVSTNIIVENEDLTRQAGPNGMHLLKSGGLWDLTNNSWESTNTLLQHSLELLELKAFQMVQRHCIRDVTS